MLLAGSSAGLSRRPGLSRRHGPRELRGAARRAGGAGRIARGAQISALTAALSLGHGRLYCVISDNNYNRSVVETRSG